MGTGGGGWFVSEVHSFEQQERQAIGSQVSRMLLNHLLGSSFFCFILVFDKSSLLLLHKGDRDHCVSLLYVLWEKSELAS